MIKIKVQNNFFREIRRLRALYNVVIYSFSGEGKEINRKINTKKIDANEKVYLYNNPQEKYLIAGNSYEFANKLNSGYLKTLREVIIIRAISALEILLIELIRETFLHKKELFNTGQKIEFNQSELLSSNSISNIWSKIINKECRNLQNQGFKEISKYYKKAFLIDFNQAPLKVTEIQYIHDIRHLLVHRLGKTDSQFRHNYKTDKKIIQITEEEFYDFMDKIECFGNYVSEKVRLLIENSDEQRFSDDVELKCLLVVVNNSDIPNKLFSSDFSFISEENVYLLNDILKSYEKNENEISVSLAGYKKVINDYISLVKAAAKKKELEVIKVDKQLFTIITKEEINKVKSILQKSNNVDITAEEIALELGIKRNKVIQIISRIKKSE
jgi:hypothetical protein